MTYHLTPFEQKRNITFESAGWQGICEIPGGYYLHVLRKNNQSESMDSDMVGCTSILFMVVFFVAGHASLEEFK